MADRLRFVVLRHDPPLDPDDSYRPLHWDLMLECNGVLWTWALDMEWKSRLSMAGKRLADHRLAYLDYEGPLSDGRGTVVRVDHGFLEWLRQSTDALEARLIGESWHGRITLTRSDKASDAWRISLLDMDSTTQA